MGFHIFEEKREDYPLWDTLLPNYFHSAVCPMHHKYIDKYGKKFQLFLSVKEKKKSFLLLFFSTQKFRRNKVELWMVICFPGQRGWFLTYGSSCKTVPYFDVHLHLCQCIGATMHAFASLALKCLSFLFYEVTHEEKNNYSVQKVMYCMWKHRNEIFFLHYMTGTWICSWSQVIFEEKIGIINFNAFK